MLILTRKTGETLHIGDDIQVTIVARDGQQTKVGVTAPPTTPVHREEVYQRIKEDQEYL